MAYLTYSTDEVQDLLDEVKDRIHIGQNYNNSGSVYTVFARIKKNAVGSVSLAGILVAGVASSIIRKRGLYWVEVLNRTSGFNLCVTTLSAPYSGTVTFGYYLDGDYYYIGVYRTGGYGGSPISLLLNTSNTNPIEFGNYYNASSQPAGWTAAES